MPLTLRIFSQTAGRKKLIDERVLNEERITVAAARPARWSSRIRTGTCRASTPNSSGSHEEATFSG